MYGTCLRVQEGACRTRWDALTLCPYAESSGQCGAGRADRARGHNMGTKIRRTTTLASLALVVVLFFAWAMPAQALIPIFLPIQGVSGVVDGPSGPVQGVIVKAWKWATQEYVWNGVTDSTGHYTLWLAPGTYELQFTDASGNYLEEWYNNKSGWGPGDAISVVSSTFTPINATLEYSARMKVIVRRSGHSLTRLPNKAILVQRKKISDSTLVEIDGTTGSDGTAKFGNLASTGYTYKESAIDTQGWFYSTDATSVFLPRYPLTPGTPADNVYIDMQMPLGSSHDMTLTVPSSKSSVTHNVNFYVTVTATRKVSGSTKMKIVAKKGSTTKTFSLKKYSYPSSHSTKYRQKLKLPSKGTWKLYALWPGNGTYATTDSITGKTVTAH
jgi:hypothetical protein